MKLKLFSITLLAIMVAGCTLEPIPEPEKEMGKMVTITATISPETRVAYDDVNRKLAWETGDTLLLAGYDGTTYKGSEKYHRTSGNSFQGIEVPGATTYKAYYPGEKVTLDANGNVQLAGTFWQQTQSGNGTTAHLSKKLLLYDEEANPLSETFSLVMKNSIIRFDLTNVPQEVGELGEVVWTVETATGFFKSMILNVTGVTFSATNSSLTAFLAFDPTVMKIAANGKVSVTLCGSKWYQWSTTVAAGKTYTAGNRYKATVSSGWTELDLLINPLSYFAEHNMADTTGTFETGHDALGLYLFNWDDAMRYNTRPATLGGKDYYLPTIQEWRAIIPGNYTYVNFSGSGTRTLSDAAVTVGGESYTMSGTFDNTGNVVYATLTYTHQFYPTLYAIARYRTENMGARNANARMVIDMKLTATPYTIGEAESADWNSVGVVSRVVPAAGWRGSNGMLYRGTNGYYWSSMGYSDNHAWYMSFSSGSASSGISNSHKTYGFSVRLVSRE